MSSVDQPAAERQQPAAAPPAAAPPVGTPDGAPALDQPFDTDALFTLRSAVAAHAADLGAGHTVDDAVLVAHELASNAVRHGGGVGRLRLWRSGDRLVCQVSDSGSGLSDPEHAGIGRPAPAVPGGRGLWIARQLSEVHIRTGPDGTTITAALPVTRPPT